MDNQPIIAGSENIIGKVKKKLTRKILIILFIFVGVGLILYLGFTLKIKIPGNPLDLLNKPSVTLKKEYKNPFSKETQYVNPFETYKNPFVVGK